MRTEKSKAREKCLDRDIGRRTREDSNCSLMSVSTMNRPWCTLSCHWTADLKFQSFVCTGGLLDAMHNLHCTGIGYFGMPENYCVEKIPFKCRSSNVSKYPVALLFREYKAHVKHWWESPNSIHSRFCRAKDCGDIVSLPDWCCPKVIKGH